MESYSKELTAKRPAHPDEAHTKSKRFFKKKGRKRVRTTMKEKLKKEVNDES